MTTEKNKLYYFIGAGCAIVLAVAVLLLLFIGNDDAGKYDKYYAAGQSAWQQGDYEAAAEALEKAVAARPEAEAYLLLAESYYARQELDMAIQVLYLGYSKTGDAGLSQRLAALKAEKNGAVAEPETAEPVIIGDREIPATERSLVLADMGLTDADLAALSQLPGLESLSLSDNALTDIAVVGELRGLSFLQISGNAIADLTPLRSLSQLKTLYIDNNPITDFTPLYALTTLKTLSMKDITITESQLTELQEALPHCSIYAEAPIAEIKEITIGDVTFTSDVTELDLSGTPLEDVSALAECTGLKRLNISGCGVEDLAPFIDLQQLQELDISGNAVTDLRPLMSLRQLRHLNASHNRIEDIAVLRYLPDLQTLALDGSALSKLDALGGLSSLSSLSLRGCGVANEDLEIFAGLSRLVVLNLENNLDLTANAVDELKKALPNCRVATSELLYAVEYGGETFRSDATAITALSAGVSDLSGLEHFSALIELVLPNNAVSSLEPLRELRELQKLDLYGNYVSDLTPLSGHTALRILDLENNAIHDLTPLSDCTALEELVANNNLITDLTALSGCTELRTLELSDNGIDDLTPLSGLYGLEVLHLNNNRITDLSPLYDLTALRTLYIRGNDLTSRDVEELEEMLPECRIVCDKDLGGFNAG